MRSSSTSVRSLVMPYKVTDQKNAQQQLRVDRWPARVAVGVLRPEID